jgi:hypothetical protein
LSSSSETASVGRAQVGRGREFEAAVGDKLSGLFNKVEHHKRIDGFSGITWNVDFQVDANLIVEASVQRRLETNINSTFIRFQDIARKHPELMAALVVDKLHVLFHHTIGKKYFPTSEYRTFVAFGFPIIAFDDLPKLVLFKQGALSAFGATSTPFDFYTRSMLSNRRTLGAKIVELLSAGPLAPREISKALGCRRDNIQDAVNLFPQVKKISTLYGLDSDSIFERLLKSRSCGKKQNSLVNAWLDARILQVLREKGVARTMAIATALGVVPNSLVLRIHQLSQSGTIVRVAKGTWELASRRPTLDS